MASLFSEEIVYPEGFAYHPGFLAGDDEQRLIAAVREIDLHPLIFQGFTAKRKVVSYGYDYNFDKRQIAPGKAIPATFEFLISKVATFLNCNTADFAEMLLTEYPPGSVINWHRDAPPFDMIAGISLLSDCSFKLRPYDKALQTRRAVIALPVARGSLYVLQGAVRSEWEHCIAPVKDTRYSITLRTLRK